MHCFLDLDGVLVDFVKGACDAHGFEVPHCRGEYNLEWTLGLSASAFWKKIEGHAFWANLPWTPDGQEILEIVEGRFGSNITLLSAPCRDPESASGKLHWIQRNLPRYARKFLLGPDKSACAGIHKVLVDDSDSNCEKFTQAGGAAVLVPRSWNTNHVIRDTVTFLRQTFE